MRESVVVVVVVWQCGEVWCVVAFEPQQVDGGDWSRAALGCFGQTTCTPSLLHDQPTRCCSHLLSSALSSQHSRPALPALSSLSDAATASLDARPAPHPLTRSRHAFRLDPVICPSPARLLHCIPPFHFCTRALTLWSSRATPARSALPPLVSSIASPFAPARICFISPSHRNKRDHSAKHI